jgi:hypothetical protein
MTFRTIREAEEALFGGPTYTMTSRLLPPSGEDRLDDMAQAWIEGRVDEVMNYVAQHYENVRARAIPVKIPAGRPRRGDRQRALELRTLGVPVDEVAKMLHMSVEWVKRWGKQRSYTTGCADEIRRALRAGENDGQIASRLGVSKRTVSRHRRDIAKDDVQ